MPLVGSAMKSKFKDTIMKGLKASFGGPEAPADAEKSWAKLAEAISGIAMDIVDELHNNASVAPGIPTAGSPASQTTVAPGKIL